jgi:RNA recognition motif-containing protein
LSFDATQSELEALFVEVGEVVEVFVPTDRDTGRPRGFAFVQFTDEVSVAAAIEKFNDFEFRGRRLRVNEAEEQRPRRPSFSEGGFGHGSPPKPWGGKSKGSRRNLRKRKRGY